MKTPQNFQKKEGKLMLKTLREDGIEEIYLPSIVGKVKRQSVAPLAEGTRESDKSSSTSIKEAAVKLREKVLKCVLCNELAATRKSVVFGAGNLKAKLVFVGEAPGHDEDLQGLPFVGRAGQLLTKMIEAIGFTRQQIFICNVLKCRPPGNRQPRPDEILNCQPYLEKQIELIHPKIICALGTFAAQTLLKTGTPISQLRGRFHDYRGVKVLCTFHPAYLLRNPGEKRKVWEDLQVIQKELGKEAS